MKWVNYTREGREGLTIPERRWKGRVKLVIYEREEQG